eukprot:tig00000553_g2122.t1
MSERSLSPPSPSFPPFRVATPASARAALLDRLAHIKFIGELYKVKLLPEMIVLDCNTRLLGEADTPDEENLEALCKLLQTTGKLLDNIRCRRFMDKLFADIEAHSRGTCERLSSRIRFLLQDVVELRAHGWVPRHEASGPKTLDEIHAEAQREEKRKAAGLAIDTKSPRRPLSARLDRAASTPLATPSSSRAPASPLATPTGAAAHGRARSLQVATTPVTPKSDDGFTTVSAKKGGRGASAKKGAAPAASPAPSPPSSTKTASGRLQSFSAAIGQPTSNIKKTPQVKQPAGRQQPAAAAQEKPAGKAGKPQQQQQQAGNGGKAQAANRFGALEESERRGSGSSLSDGQGSAASSTPPLSPSSSTLAPTESSSGVTAVGACLEVRSGSSRAGSPPPLILELPSHAPSAASASKRPAAESIRDLLDEFLCSEELADTLESLGELRLDDDGRVEVVHRAVLVGIDRRARERDLLARLMVAGHGRALLHGSHIARALEHVIGSLEDIGIDVPHAPALVGEFVGRCMARSALPVSFFAAVEAPAVADAAVAAMRLALGDAAAGELCRTGSDVNWASLLTSDEHRKVVLVDSSA